MSGLAAAFRFLTILPIGKSDNMEPKEAASSMLWYPLVGLAIGLIGYGIYHLSRSALGQLPASAISVVGLIILSGGIHIDGLADTCDAFFSGRERSMMLDIMRDPRCGSMGAVAVSSDIILKTALIYSLPSHIKMISFILMCMLGRTALVCGVGSFPYARKEGKVSCLRSGMNARIVIIACLLSGAIMIALASFAGLVIFTCMMIVTYSICGMSTKLIGGITGDVLGAVNELIEISTLVAMLTLFANNG